MGWMVDHGFCRATNHRKHFNRMSRRIVVTSQDVSLTDIQDDFSGSHAYMVSRAGAQRLLNHALPIELQLDSYLAVSAMVGLGPRRTPLHTNVSVGDVPSVASRGPLPPQGVPCVHVGTPMWSPPTCAPSVPI